MERIELQEAESMSRQGLESELGKAQDAHAATVGRVMDALDRLIPPCSRHGRGHEGECCGPDQLIRQALIQALHGSTTQ